MATAKLHKLLQQEREGEAFKCLPAWVTMAEVTQEGRGPFKQLPFPSWVTPLNDSSTSFFSPEEAPQKEMPQGEWVEMVSLWGAFISLSCTTSASEGLLDSSEGLLYSGETGEGAPSLSYSSSSSSPVPWGEHKS